MGKFFKDNKIAQAGRAGAAIVFEKFTSSYYNKLQEKSRYNLFMK